MATQSPCLLCRRASCDFSWNTVFSSLRYRCESPRKAAGHPIHENHSASILCLAVRCTRTYLMASSNTQKDRFEPNVSLCKQVFPDSWSKNLGTCLLLPENSPIVIPQISISVTCTSPLQITASSVSLKRRLSCPWRLKNSGLQTVKR